MHNKKPAALDVSSKESPDQALVTAINQGEPGLQVTYAVDWCLWNKSLATTARALFEDGVVDLVQRKVPGPRMAKFEYIAIKRSSVGGQI
ncbi:MAG: hypothetical protein GKR98_11890 [Boseongicola sp.]|nr:MAG: hypothetical protein GKR98_11890 [Boseongicola sp.]